MSAPRFAFLDHPHPLAIAHRGGGLEAEENTGAAFARAAALGYRYIETDIQASRDGVAVVFHDAMLERMTGRPGPIAARDWAELARLTTKGGATLMRLDQALAEFPALRFNLDPKSDHAVAPLAEAVRRANAIDRVCVGSFETHRVRRLRALLGERLCWSPSHRGVARLWLAGHHLPAGRLAFPVVQVPTRHHGIPVVTRGFVAAARARGIDVHVWTVDIEAEMERLLDLGVGGVMTDRPSLLKAALQRRGQWTGD